MLVQQHQHSTHQNDEKPVQRPPHVAVGVRRGIGNTAVSVSLRRHVGAVVEAQLHEEVDEDVGVLLVQLAVRTDEHFVEVAVRRLE